MKRLNIVMMAFVAFVSSGVCDAQTVVSQSCEQSIVVPKASGRYLWLPIEEKAPEGKVQVILSGLLQMECNVRMARENVDYYMPLDLKPYFGHGVMKVCVQNVPTSSVCFSKLAQNDDADFAAINEKYRPVYHHTPKRGWMNDPNGMFYKDGVWNLYYQFNPYGSMWGNMHWGHSTSTDLFHWEDKGVALAPDVWGTIFSGSCVVDKNSNSVVSLYTTSRPTPFGGDVQAQCIAYSNDGGKTFTKFEGNPVLTDEAKDFRDPKAFWNPELQAWNLVLAVGQEMRIFSSKDLKNWKFESAFGKGYGNHDGVWECPDLMKLQVRGTDTQKWMLICNINPGGPFGGSATQYFVGDFDGHTFTCDHKDTRWMDYGKDHYATVTFDNAPDGRRVALAWMSNWQYANEVPTKQFRSANSVPRDLDLFEYNGQYYCGVTPSKELLALRGKKTANPSEACEIVVDAKGPMTLTLSNTKGEQVTMRYDKAAKTFTMNREKSGDTAFSEAFPGETTAPVYGNIRQFRIFIDRCSIEVFDAEGRLAMTNLVFPTEPYSKLTVKGGKASVYQLAGF